MELESLGPELIDAFTKNRFQRIARGSRFNAPLHLVAAHPMLAGRRDHVGPSDDDLGRKDLIERLRDCSRNHRFMRRGAMEIEHSVRRQMTGALRKKLTRGEMCGDRRAVAIRRVRVDHDQIPCLAGATDECAAVCGDKIHPRPFLHVEEKLRDVDDEWIELDGIDLDLWIRIEEIARPGASTDPDEKHPPDVRVEHHRQMEVMRVLEPAVKWSIEVDACLVSPPEIERANSIDFADDDSMGCSVASATIESMICRERRITTMKTVRLGSEGHDAMRPALVRSGPGVRLRVPLVIGLGAFLMLLEPAWSLWTGGSTGEIQAQVQGSGEAYEDELQKGQDFLRQHKYEEALKSFKRANAMRGKKSAEPFFWMAQAYQGLFAYKNVLESCDKVIELGGSDTKLQAQAYNLKGLALQSLAQGKHQGRLQEAEAVFRQALTLEGAPSIAHYNLGFVIMQQGRDPEGIAALQKYLELERSGAYTDTARKLIENPRRTREAYAPDFSIITSEAEHISLEDLRGKVVVLDFWGTWCPPCVASVPSLRGLNKKYAKEPSFVMIGISSDREEEPWRKFTAKNKMVWPQYWDRDRKIQQAFVVYAFPTYVVIDHEGIVRFRASGTSWKDSLYLDDAIRKLVKVVAKTAAAD